MVAFPKVGFNFKLRCDISPINFISSRMLVSRIIESGELLTEKEVLRYYGLGTGDLVTTNTLARLSVFSRPRVLFWDFTSGKYRIYPWDEQTAKRIWERLVPIGQTDPETVPVSATPISADDIAPILKKKLAALKEIVSDETESIEKDFLAYELGKQKTQSAQFWAETARIKAEFSALKATLKKHFPSLKFD